MDPNTFEQAIRLGKKVEHFFIAVVDEKGVPHVNSARQIERRNVMATEETKELSTAAAAETDADAECTPDCCVCCCCDTEEECRMEA